jgi:lipopolysaccharide transport system ATP-binding protein
MNVRLAFSLATAVRPDVLIIDEALAVGDQNFQQKSLARIRELQDGGTSLLFVSHDAAIIPRVCKRALILDHGALHYDGSAEGAIAEYGQLAVSYPRNAEPSAEHG